jgi:hypothetical protein
MGLWAPGTHMVSKSWVGSARMHGDASVAKPPRPGQGPCEFIGFGAMDVTKPYKFIGFVAMDVAKPYEFIGFGAMDVNRLYEFIRLSFCQRDPKVVLWPSPPLPAADPLVDLAAAKTISKGSRSVFWPKVFWRPKPFSASPSLPAADPLDDFSRPPLPAAAKTISKGSRSVFVGQGFFGGPNKSFFDGFEVGGPSGPKSDLARSRTRPEVGPGRTKAKKPHIFKKFVGFGDSWGPKPYKLTGIGDSYGPKPYKFVGFGDSYGPKPHKFMGFGDSYGPKPYKFIGFGDIYGPKPYKFIGFGAIAITKPYKLIGFGDIYGPKPGLLP